MLQSLAVSFHHHIRFYSAVLCGIVAWGVARALGLPVPALVAGDTFYLVFLTLILVMVARQKTDLEQRAQTEDEGIVIVVLITIVTMGFFCVAVFEALSRRQGLNLPALVLAGAGALLGWLVLHTVMAFHYADLHYFDDKDTPDDDGRDLQFPGCAVPGAWDFLYFSFVIGMTCQVSDVQVKTAAMRRNVLAHGVASFFFNTVFIAMAVNAGVSLGS
jgi:uncharacterized membrane protein